jgi:hypothetical protein
MEIERPGVELDAAPRAGSRAIAVAISRFVNASAEPQAGRSFASWLSFGVIAGYSGWSQRVAARRILRLLRAITQKLRGPHNHTRAI